jgi:hypothetical protein
MNNRLMAYNLGRRWKKLRRAIARRPDYRGQLLERLPRCAIGAEIGVWQGEFTARILAISKPRELHLIDPWLYQPEFSDHGYGGVVAKRQEDMDEIHASVANGVGTVAGVMIHRMKSAEALERFADGYFDWLYVDGNHEYEYVCADLECARRKVRTGGFVTGDDYNWGKAKGFPVRRALREFAAKHGLGERVEIIGSQFLLQLP